MMRFYDKVIIVTGAAEKKGIGRQIALEFAREGGNVVIVDIKDGTETVAEVNKLGGESLAVKADVTSLSSVQRTVNHILERFDKIDVLVNNAGICPFIPFLKISEKVWDITIDVNLKGPFLCSQTVAKIWVETGLHGKIVNMSSCSAEISSKNQVHYAASKGGVQMLTRGMALELAPYGINVNAIAPAGIQTNILHAGNEMLSEERLSIHVQNYDKKFFSDVSARDVAQVALFLASPDADNITGETIWITGDKPPF